MGETAQFQHIPSAICSFYSTTSFILSSPHLCSIAVCFLSSVCLVSWCFYNRFFHLTNRLELLFSSFVSYYLSISITLSYSSYIYCPYILCVGLKNSSDNLRHPGHDMCPASPKRSQRAAEAKGSRRNLTSYSGSFICSH